MTDQIDRLIGCAQVPDLHKWATTPNLINLRNELALHFSMPENRQGECDPTRKLAEAEARIEKLEDAIMDALDENGYSLSPEKVSPRWVETARDAIGWRGVGITKGLQDALRAEYMRPCDERP